MFTQHENFSFAFNILTEMKIVEEKFLGNEKSAKKFL
jgi:hypothetical protein